jgi:hypothetical protein
MPTLSRGATEQAQVLCVFGPRGARVCGPTRSNSRSAPTTRRRGFAATLRGFAATLPRARPWPPCALHRGPGAEQFSHGRAGCSQTLNCAAGPHLIVCGCLRPPTYDASVSPVLRVQAARACEQRCNTQLTVNAGAAGPTVKRLSSKTP